MSPDRIFISESIVDHEQSIKKRISNAMRQPPVDGIFANNGKLLPFYKIADNRNNEACTTHEVCNHGYKGHSLQVMKNFFILSDIANMDIPDAILVPPVLLHDIIYGIKGMQWNEYSLPNHQKMVVRYIEKISHKFLYKLLDLNYERTKESFALLNQWAPVYRRAIETDTEEMILYTETLDNSYITDAQLFPALFCLADKLAYYDRNRLQGLTKRGVNDYFDLANAVNSYTITRNATTLVYSVSLEGMSFAEWQERTNSLYLEVKRLGRAVGDVLGMEFAVQEAA